jgi:hypothetical protein
MSEIQQLAVEIYNGYEKVGHQRDDRNYLIKG